MDGVRGASLDCAELGTRSARAREIKGVTGGDAGGGGGGTSVVLESRGDGIGGCWGCGASSDSNSTKLLALEVTCLADCD